MNHITEAGIQSASSLPLRYWPDPILHIPCERLEESVDVKVQLAEAMIKTMRLHQGLGLAGPQVGISKKIFVVDMNDRAPVVVINPTVLEIDDAQDTIKIEEGCLSIPGYFEDRYRSSLIKLTFETVMGEVVSQTFHRIDAFAVQHELDHLSGKLFIDDLSNLKLQRVRKKVKRALKI